jgi:hypothetical protein
MDRALPRPLDWHWLRWAVLAGSVGCLVLAVLLAWRAEPIDAFNYWEAWEGGLYDEPWFGGAYIYSPVVAQLIWPLTLLPFDVFRVVLMAGSLGALWYMVGPYALGYLALLFPGVIGDLGVGSPHLLMAAALVAGVRGQAWAWSVLPLTKVTPAVAGLWAARFQPRSVLIGLAICVASFVLAPGLWVDWAVLLLDATGRSPNSTEALLTTAPLAARLPLAVAVAVLATWRRWPVLLPVSAFLALPVIWGAGACLLLACWPLSRRGGSEPQSSPEWSEGRPSQSPPAEGVARSY